MILSAILLKSTSPFAAIILLDNWIGQLASCTLQSLNLKTLNFSLTSSVKLYQDQEKILRITEAQLRYHYHKVGDTTQFQVIDVLPNEILYHNTIKLNYGKILAWFPLRLLFRFTLRFHQS